MNEFVTWEMFTDFAMLTTIIFVLTQFTKNIPYIEIIPTKYWSVLISFVLIIASNINFNAFKWIDIILYLVSSIFISCSANGIYDLGTKLTVKKLKKRKMVNNNE